MLRRRIPPANAGAALAAGLSAVLPGLGQLYQERWARGLLMALLPILALALGGVFVLLADPLTSAVVRHARLVALLVIGGLFAYHLAVVADAFFGARPARRPTIELGALAALALVLAIAYGGAYKQSAAWASFISAVFEPIAVPVPQTSAGEPAPAQWSGRERLNVLLLGLDARHDSFETLNTDTLIVLSLDPLNDTAAMLSIPRDTLVTIPGVGQDKVNAAYFHGGGRGAELARRTVEQLLGIPIHSYAIVDFQSFTGIVDGVGGVVVDVKRPLRDEVYPTVDFGIERLNVLAGPQLMDGITALRYARSRYASNDFSRARRQQDVLAALRVRLASGGLARVPGLVERFGPAVRTNFDPGNILPLARTGIALRGDAIRSEVLQPCGGAFERCELREQIAPEGYYLIPDRPKVLDLVAELFYDVRVRQEAARVEVR
ncbi:MAG: LCP family protein, partial [Candidatus Limnocylindria bacterium]